ncbi:sulfite reductase flavoprotein subunit alpha [Novosphingobium sp. 9]|uniref:sulfite reductase flavoprotein subunit alpha n=1 Tax=Novosphingobium sp. 9 TaxID=2025349 RepID=UPI0021B4FEF6|nr:sulfite reductase flavoprotein subunit alpha [Novosphingobium sp. 9]
MLFQIHWFLGITAGLILAVMGVTGALLSFEDEIMARLSPGIVVLAPDGLAPQAPEKVFEQIAGQRPGAAIQRLTVESDPKLAWQVRLAPADRKQGRGERSFVDPRDGRLLGQPNGAAFFETVENLHRWLAMPGGPRGAGRQLTGISALALFFFALSGLYLRWPKKPLDWRAWLVLDWRKSGRNLWRELHAVIGGWVALAYLLSAMTGLWWSYDWYRNAAQVVLTGSAQSEGGEGRGKGKPPVVSLAQAWPSFTRVMDGRWASVTIFMPDHGSKARFRATPPDARFERMTDDVKIDLATGRVLDVDPYAKRSLGKVIAGSMLDVHRGAIFGLAGRIVILLTSLTMPLFTITGLLLYFARRRRKRALGLAAEAAPAVAGHGSDILVAYASQTGSAERLARQTASALGGARVLPLAEVDAATMSQARRALFVVSTYGEGEAPDRARRFAREAMATAPEAANLDYAVLALGDREYPQFCAFGHEVDRWLHSGGGRRLFDTIEVDGEDANAERLWQQELAALGADTMAADFAPAAYAPWRLVSRVRLNEGSAGGPVYHVRLEPLDGTAHDWQAGDIAEVRPGNDPNAVEAFLAASDFDGEERVEGRSLHDHLMRSVLPEWAGGTPEVIVADLRLLPHREYSIASIPADGGIELVIRQVAREDGTLGLGSGWLTHHARMGETIALRLHANPGFRAGDAKGPLVLIGNGTGIAGLRGHLRQAAAQGQTGHWLLLGERNRAHDALFDDELAAWLADGTLSRLDRAWSRDGGAGARYVQDLIPPAADLLREVAEGGGSILVCGSLLGMAPAVDAALREVLGDAQLEAMAERGRYLRDIY